MKVGIIGAGLMGSAIAHRLLGKGFGVYMYNRTEERTNELIKKGAIRLDYPAAFGKKCNFVIVCVTDGLAVKQILFDNRGLIHCNNPRLIVINVSTVLPEDSIYCANNMKKYGFKIIEAPIMGGPDAARKGEVVSIVSGNKNIFEKCRKILNIFTKRIFYLGNSDGIANHLKLGLNLNIALIAIALSESIIFIKKSKVDPRIFLEILNSTYFKTGLSEIKGPRMIESNFEPRFFLKNMLKDIQLLNDCAKNNGTNLWFSSLTEQVYRIAVNRGYSELDYTAILKLFLEFNNLDHRL